MSDLVKYLPNGQWEILSKTQPGKISSWAQRLSKAGVEPEEFFGLLREKLSAAYDPYRDLSPLEKALKDEVGKTHTVEIHPDIDHLYRAKSMVADKGKPMHISEFKKTNLPQNIVQKLPRDNKGFVSTQAIDDHIAALPKRKVNVQVIPYKLGQQMHRQNPEYVLSAQMHPEEQAKLDPQTQEEWNHIKPKQHYWHDDIRKNPSINQIGWVRVDPHHNKESAPAEHNHWHLDEIQSDFQNHDKLDQKMPLSAKEHPKYKEILDEILGGKEPLSARYIQSLKDKISEAATPQEKEERERDLRNAGEVHTLLRLRNSDPQYFKKHPRVTNMLNTLSYDHEDPQHMLHSVANALGRKLGVESTSIDMPQDQATKNALITANSLRRGHWQPLPDHMHAAGWDRLVNNYITQNGVPPELHENLHNKANEVIAQRSEDDPDLKDALNKLGPKHMKEFMHLATKHPQGWMYEGAAAPHWNGDNSHEDNSGKPVEMSDDLKNKLSNLSNDERTALSSALLQHFYNNVQDAAGEAAGLPPRPDEHAPSAEYVYDEEEPQEPPKLPVHQIETYNKRPKKLGYQEVAKDSVLGHHPHDRAKKVQYSKLHKHLGK